MKANYISYAIALYACFTLSLNKTFQESNTSSPNESVPNNYLLENKAALAPGLLIDVSINNSNPAPNQPVCYKIRYRCASTTEHCTNTYVDLIIPDGLDYLPIAASGNIAAVTTSPGSPSGTYVRIDLETPGNPGVLEAGSSGVINVCGTFPCLSSGAQSPVAGTVLNMVEVPEIFASGISSETSSNPTFTYPTLDACAPPSASSGTFLKKEGLNSPNMAEPGSFFTFNLETPPLTDALIIEDIFPPELTLSTGCRII